MTSGILFSHKIGIFQLQLVVTIIVTAAAVAARAFIVGILEHHNTVVINMYFRLRYLGAKIMQSPAQM